MNENIKIIFGLVGGLAMFLYGMNSMSDALQKAAGEKNEKDTQLPDKKSTNGCTCRCSCNSSSAKQLCDYCNGNWLCKCVTYDFATGDFRYFRSEYRYDYDSSAYGIQDKQLHLPDNLYRIYSVFCRQKGAD